MGNYRFRLSAMLPNAWFYKLKDMSKTSPHNNNSNSNSSPNPFKHKKMHPTTTTTISSSSPSHHHQTLQPRKSYYFTREQHTPLPAPTLKPDYLPNSPINPKTSDVPFPESPRKSTKRRSSRRRRRRNNIKSPSSSSATTTTKFVNSSVSAGCSCRATLESVWATKSDSIPYYSSSPSDTVSVSPSPHHQCSPDEFDSNRNEATTDISEGGPASSWSSSTTTTTTTTTTCSCRISSSTTDIIIEDVDTKKSSSSSSTTTTQKFEKVDEFDTISEIELPPILTKPQKYMTKPPPPRRSSSNGGSSSLLSVKVSKKETMKSSNNTLKDQKTSPMMNRRCSSTGSPGLKLRANSPKIFASRKIQACSSSSSSSSSKKTTMSSGTAASTSLMRSRKKNLSDSFVIIKSSLDPQRDFKESIVEMIVENNLRASKDLEELLACYLSLNSNEYHDLIVEVFQQIWFDFTDIRL